MYVRFLFVPTDLTTEYVVQETEETRERGPFPASTAWVPTFQRGVLRGLSLADDGKRSWKPESVDTPVNLESFTRLERCGVPLVRSAGPRAPPCVFYASPDKEHAGQWVMWGLPAPTKVNDAKQGVVTLQWEKLRKQQLGDRMRSDENCRS